MTRNMNEVKLCFYPRIPSVFIIGLSSRNAFSVSNWVSFAVMLDDILEDISQFEIWTKVWCVKMVITGITRF